MGAGNPFFGQELTERTTDGLQAVVNFPNWGIVQEDTFRLMLLGRLRARGLKLLSNSITRRPITGGFSPTEWVVRLE